MSEEAAGRWILAATALNFLTTCVVVVLLCMQRGCSVPW